MTKKCQSIYTYNMLKQILNKERIPPKNQPFSILMLHTLHFLVPLYPEELCSLLYMTQPQGKNPLAELRFSLVCNGNQVVAPFFPPISFVTTRFTYSFMSIFHKVALCIYQENNMSLRQQRDSC